MIDYLIIIPIRTWIKNKN